MQPPRPTPTPRLSSERTRLHSLDVPDLHALHHEGATGSRPARAELAALQTVATEEGAWEGPNWHNSSLSALVEASHRSDPAFAHPGGSHTSGGASKGTSLRTPGPGQPGEGARTTTTTTEQQQMIEVSASRGARGSGSDPSRKRGRLAAALAPASAQPPRLSPAARNASSAFAGMAVEMEEVEAPTSTTTTTRSGRAASRRVVGGQRYPTPSPTARAGPTGPEPISPVDGSMPGHNKRRFLWTEDLHRTFIASIFDLGLQGATPKALFEQMRASAPAEMTSDHIKSHLQKFRNNSRDSRDRFMRDCARAYDEASARAKIVEDETGVAPFPTQFSTYPLSMPVNRQSDPPTVYASTLSRRQDGCERCSELDALMECGVGVIEDEDGPPSSSASSVHNEGEGGQGGRGGGWGTTTTATGRVGAAAVSEATGGRTQGVSTSNGYDHKASRTDTHAEVAVEQMRPPPLIRAPASDASSQEFNQEEIVALAAQLLSARNADSRSAAIFAARQLLARPTSVTADEFSASGGAVSLAGGVSGTYAGLFGKEAAIAKQMATQMRMHRAMLTQQEDQLLQYASEHMHLSPGEALPAPAGAVSAGSNEAAVGSSGNHTDAAVSGKTELPQDTVAASSSETANTPSVATRTYTSAAAAAIGGDPAAASYVPLPRTLRDDRISRAPFPTNRTHTHTGAHARKAAGGVEAGVNAVQDGVPTAAGLERMLQGLFQLDDDSDECTETDGESSEQMSLAASHKEAAGATTCSKPEGSDKAPAFDMFGDERLFHFLCGGRASHGLVASSTSDSLASTVTTASTVTVVPANIDAAP